MFIVPASGAPACTVFVVPSESAAATLGFFMPDSATIASRLLDVIDSDILPLTERGVAGGNKVFLSLIHI